MASNKGQSEPAGTCEKQEKRSFSLSIPCEAKLARACPNFRPILPIKSVKIIIQHTISLNTLRNGLP